MTAKKKPARKKPAAGKPARAQDPRRAIRARAIIDALEQHILGAKKMSATQVNAALALPFALRILLPPLREIEATQGRLAEAQAQLVSMTRISALDEMGAAIAHELNQPIGSIANILRGLKARLQRGALTLETGAEALDRATEQALYASGVIQRVRTFVDQRQPQVQRLDLARLACNTLDLLDWEITRDRVTARAATPPDLPAVLGDPVMIQQVLVNLARNALDAMRGVDLPRRELTIEARHSLDARQIELTLTDTGPGVPEEASARIFSPFFSTRSGGMGVGLGICRSIIELHRGRLWFTPGEAGGSVFHIALPLAAAETPTEEARP